MDDFKDKIIQRFGRLFETFGVNPILGHIFGYLISSDEPKPITMIAKDLDLSKAAISIHIRVLEQMGYCSKMMVGRDRQHYYVVEESYIVQSYLTRLEKEKQFLRELETLLKSDDDSSPVAKKRLESLYDFTDYMIGEQKKLLDSWDSNQES